MAKKKKRRGRAPRGPGVNPQAVQIIQRRFGGRRPDRDQVVRALLQEAGRRLDKTEFQDALELAEQAARLARSEEERGACQTLLAEVYFRRASSADGRARLADLESAVELAPQKPLYRLHLARALEQDGRAGEALGHYQVANKAWSDSGVGYLWSVAALEVGRPLPKVPLTPAEQNTLNIARHLLASDLRSARLAEPVLGSSMPLWRALASMLTDKGVAPVEQLKATTSMLGDTKAAGMAYYYLGVAALRAGDLEAAWRALADAQKAGYSSPWLKENLSCLARVRAIQGAEAGDWRAVIRVGEPILREMDDRVLAETVSLAHFHLGYDAAQAGDWATATRHWQQAEGYANNRYLAQNLALAREQQEDWEGAAQAWREMIRRRPRKEDHPNYLDDNQVVSLWRHAAECYKRANNPVEAIVCLRNGLQCAPDDMEMRSELSEALMANEQFGAAESELNNVLERDPDNVEALVRLGQLYKMDDSWHGGHRAAEVLKRALELAPDHQEARDLLSIHFIEQGNRFMGWGMYSQAAEQYQQGLKYLPDHPLLYVHLGEAEQYQGNHKAAREHLLRAYELEPDRARIVGPVLHHLLHLKSIEEDVERLLPAARQMPGILPHFWIDQAKQVLACELGRAWAERFFEEALALVGREWVPQTRAEVLVDIVSTLVRLHQSTSDLGRMYRRRIDREVPNSGAGEYVNGLIAALEEQNWGKAERLLNKARQKAGRAGEAGLLNKIGAAERLFFASPGELYDILEGILS